MSNLKLWEDVDDTELEAQSAEMHQNTGSEFLKLEVGRNVVRFLPPRAGGGSKTPQKIIYEHFVDGIGQNGGTFRFTCPRSTTRGQESCPMCDEADRLRATGNVLDEKKAKRMYPSKRAYANVIDRNAPELGPRVISFGKSILDQLDEIKNDPDGGKWWDPSPQGFDVIINRAGKGKEDTKYTVRMAKKNSPLHEEEDQIVEWAERMHNLEKYAQLMDGEELVEALGAEVRATAGKRLRDGGGSSSRRALDTGHTEKPMKSANKTKPKRTAQQTIDVDEEEFIDPDADSGDDVPY